MLIGLSCAGNKGSAGGVSGASLTASLAGAGAMAGAGAIDCQLAGNRAGLALFVLAGNPSRTRYSCKRCRAVWWCTFLSPMLLVARLLFIMPCDIASDMALGDGCSASVQLHCWRALLNPPLAGLHAVGHMQIPLLRL
jgi:hypothetical protein